MWKMWNPYKHCDCFLCCNKSYQRKFGENLKEKFFNTCKFYNSDNDKFTLLLRKVVYPFEYMDEWQKFNESSLPEKEDFYSHLTIEDITDVDYAHTKRVCKNFEIKTFWEYHGSYV